MYRHIRIVLLLWADKSNALNWLQKICMGILALQDGLKAGTAGPANRTRYSDVFWHFYSKATLNHLPGMIQSHLYMTNKNKNLKLYLNTRITPQLHSKSPISSSEKQSNPKATVSAPRPNQEDSLCQEMINHLSRISTYECGKHHLIGHLELQSRQHLELSFI